MNVRFEGWGVHDCERTEAAGVQCKEKPPPTTPKPPPTTPRYLITWIDMRSVSQNKLLTALENELIIIIWNIGQCHAYISLMEDMMQLVYDSREDEINKRVKNLFSYN